MADLAQLDLRARGAEARLRALLEDLVEYYKGVYPGYPLALAIWFLKSLDSSDHNLLLLYTGPPSRQIAGPTRVSLLWRTGSSDPPLANIYATSVDFFANQLSSNRQGLAQYFNRSEVLYFDKQALPQEILQAFNVITEPSGLLKGWYVRAEEFAKSKAIRGLLSSYSHMRPHIGLVKIQESSDFLNCRGLLHHEIGQRWVPVSPGALTSYTFYNDLQDGNPCYFLFEAGALYEIRKFEVKTAPEYSARVIEKPCDDRYTEVYLRAVRPTLEAPSQT